jgi:hypothetical protein
LIILDCISRLDQQLGRGGLTYSYQSEGHPDEMSYLRSILKEPRKNWQRDQYDWSKDKDSCWVVTAYYGHPDHPNVQAIRELRERLVADSKLSAAVLSANKIYQQIGQSRFGQWWRLQVTEAPLSLPKLLSAAICGLLMAGVRFTSRMAHVGK